MTETDRTKEVNDLVSDIIAGNNAEAQQKFNDQITSRAQDAIDLSLIHISEPTRPY